MLQNLSLQELEELHVKLKEVQKILNPKHFGLPGLYKTRNYHAIRIYGLDLEVCSYLNQRLIERDNK